ncbi:MAG TPA: phosphoribosyl-AMP cyclohydrolase [Acidimicrobiales bacterium]|nr:phosphoribosyl-AMP cyclohydrolase [Acidimicrobiales bacterium]
MALDHSALEEGSDAVLDFAKLAKVGAGAEPVLPVVLQDAESGEVLFVGYANQLALEETLGSGIAVLWSTSRQELWRKGATSGDELALVEVRVNCEQNSLLYRVRPRTGGACHTHDGSGGARRTCYYRRLVGGPGGTRLEFVEGFRPAR